jgi:AmpD protein
VWQLVPDTEKAWHAGESVLHGEKDCNEFSIGIEIEDMTNDPYPEPQLEAAALLVSRLCRGYKISLNRVVGHQHIAPGRKVDPGPDFPWRDFLIRVALLGG